MEIISEACTFLSECILLRFVDLLFFLLRQSRQGTADTDKHKNLIRVKSKIIDKIEICNYSCSAVLRTATKLFLLLYSYSKDKDIEDIDNLKP